jgi:hypothetical protein
MLLGACCSCMCLWRFVVLALSDLWMVVWLGCRWSSGGRSSALSRLERRRFGNTGVGYLYIYAIED